MTFRARPSVEYELRQWSSGPSTGHVISCSGELDLQAAPELRELLCRLFDLGFRDLVVDLTNATFVDSTTIGVLTGRLKRLRAAEGGSLVLVCANPFVLRTFQIAGMDRVFEIYPTLPGALARGPAR
jgi:anti-sigma B factor antagonist